MAIDAQQVADAHGEYNPLPESGSVQYHRVPAHRTPSDIVVVVVAGLGIQFFLRDRSIDFDCYSSANLGRD